MKISGQSFVLDIADLYRDAVTVPKAFRAVSIHNKRPADNMERLVRRMTGEAIRKQQLVAKMIDKIKALFKSEASTDSSQGLGDNCSKSPRKVRRRWRDRRLPRTRGDGPDALDALDALLQAPPHTRGWTRRPPEEAWV